MRGAWGYLSWLDASLVRPFTRSQAIFKHRRTIERTHPAGDHPYAAEDSTTPLCVIFIKHLYNSRIVKVYP